MFLDIFGMLLLFLILRFRYYSVVRCFGLARAVDLSAVELRLRLRELVL